MVRGAGIVAPAAIGAGQERKPEPGVQVGQTGRAGPDVEVAGLDQLAEIERRRQIGARAVAGNEHIQRDGQRMKELAEGKSRKQAERYRCVTPPEHVIQIGRAFEGHHGTEDSGHLDADEGIPSPRNRMNE